MTAPTTAAVGFQGSGCLGSHGNLGLLSPHLFSVIVPPFARFASSAPRAELSHPAKDANSPVPGHNGRMKFRITTAVAFGLGYILGTKAGRERYDQIVKVSGKVRRSAPVAGSIGVVTDKAKAAASLSVERARDAVSSRLGWRDGDEAADAIASSMANDLASVIKGHRVPTPRPRD